MKPSGNPEIMSTDGGSIDGVAPNTSSSDKSPAANVASGVSRQMAPDSTVKNVSDDVTFISYNPTGFSSEKIEWFKDLLETTQCTFAGIQEHFRSQFQGKRKATGDAFKVFNDKQVH